MKITKYLHSCLLLKNGGEKILFDPGKFSFAEGLVKPKQFQDLRAIILTHYHPDHIDEDSLETIIKNNPGVEVLVNSEIHAKLAEKDIDTRIFEHGTISFSGFTIKAIDAPHEKILADTIPQNTAYVVNDIFLHPGDSLSENLYPRKGIKTLALPIMAPWATELQIYDFAVKMAPETVLPIHDGFAKDFFLQSRHQNFAKFLGEQNIKFAALAKPGDSISV
jgi:L-ascorbate metabolism protein UlaG (beta-lactamase superfamily)